jgi:hypothetical protein
MANLVMPTPGALTDVTTTSLTFNAPIIKQKSSDNVTSPVLNQSSGAKHFGPFVNFVDV